MSVQNGQTPDCLLTARVKHHALHDLNCDLAGVADIERFANAPLKMSPQGIMPRAHSVVVMGLHHPDAAIELGGRSHPQEIGPYEIQYGMNARLDEISYRMALFLEDEGFEAVPIVSSNIWRYKGYKELPENFAPDLSHLHAAVAAGLADFGLNGLAITPEFGARQRWVTVITDAALQPTPLLKPGSVCDQCMLCVKHCMSQALSKETSGWNIVRIENHEYRYIRKNLWRCAWGEHFDLDLDLDLPERVDEQVILEAVAKHGTRDGEMGSCLRYCVPADLRFFDPSYTDAPRRLKRLKPQSSSVAPRLHEQVQSIGVGLGADFTIVRAAESLRPVGIEITDFLPDAATAITVGVHHNGPVGRDCEEAAKQRAAGGAGATPESESEYDERFYWVTHNILVQSAYDICRELERYGYEAVTLTDLPERQLAGHIEGAQPDRRLRTLTVLTNATMPETAMRLPSVRPPRRTGPAALARDLKRVVTMAGADLVGIAPASRIGKLAGQLAASFDGEKFLVARDRQPRSFTYDPEVSSAVRRVKIPDDYLSAAKSVLVIGIRIPRATADCTARTPAEAVGPYAFAEYESVNLLRAIAWRALRLLEDRGFNATWTLDLAGIGSLTAGPRGEQPDIFSNRFAALAAGLARIGRCGLAVNPRFDADVRFISLVTDAEVEAGDVLQDNRFLSTCDGCSRAFDACPTGAFAGEVVVRVEGVQERFRKVERNRCDWAKRYSLIGSEGNDYMGWNLTVPVPDEITPEALAAGLRKHPPISKYRPCNFEQCLMACPCARPQHP